MNVFERAKQENPSDQEAIQGLWRLVSCVFQGRPVVTGITHIQFDGNRVKRIDPKYVDGGDWAHFELDPTASPKRFTRSIELIGKGGVPFLRVDRWLYEVEGDTLRLCYPRVFGNYPDALSEQTNGVYTLVRDFGPPPQTKRASGKKPFDDPVLSRLTWDDNQNHWAGMWEIAPGRRFMLTVSPEDADPEPFLQRCRPVFQRLLRDEPSLRLHAASGELRDLYNRVWSEEEEAISTETFAGRLTLESVTFDEGSDTHLWYDDGDLFAGHSILIRVDEQGEFLKAPMEG